MDELRARADRLPEVEPELYDFAPHRVQLRERADAIAARAEVQLHRHELPAGLRGADRLVVVVGNRLEADESVRD